MPTEIEDLKNKLAEAEKAAEENLSGWKRSKADYLNLQKEIEKNKQAWADFSELDVIRELLPIWVGFNALLENLPESAEVGWVQGLTQQIKLLEDFFSGHQVVRIQTMGQEFDPEWHEAVGREKQEGFTLNKIIREIAPGFMMKNKLIFPSKVIVAE